jgi:hypothetical protein
MTSRRRRRSPRPPRAWRPPWPRRAARRADPASGRTSRRRRRLAEVAHGEEALGRLAAGVVDVVLDLDAVAGGALDAGERVAEHHVAQVADVGLLVRVDAGVLDDDLAPARGQVERRLDHPAHEARRVDVGVEVGPDGLDPGDAGGGTTTGGELGGDLRRRAPQRLGQPERDGAAVVARLVVGNGQHGDVERVGGGGIGEQRPDGVAQRGLECGDQVGHRGARLPPAAAHRRGGRGTAPSVGRSGPRNTVQVTVARTLGCRLPWTSRTTSSDVAIRYIDKGALRLLGSDRSSLHDARPFSRPPAKEP